jgi:hypothetical protein
MLTAFLKVWDDVEIEKVFDKHKEQAGLDQKSAFLSGAKLQAALQELGIHPAGSTERVDPDEFKRMARQPNEAEQWFQMIPFASLLSRSLSKTTLGDLENLQTGEIALGLQVFSQGVQVILEQRLNKLKKLMNEEKKFQNLHGDNVSKFGGVLEGGSVEDFHHGLSDRLGNRGCSRWYLAVFLAWLRMIRAQDTRIPRSRRACATSTARRA